MRRIRGWPATLCEPGLLNKPVALRPCRVRDARTWSEIRIRNAPWLRPWEPTNPETPHYRYSVTSYLATVAAMRHKALLGQALPWVITFGDEVAGQLTVESIVWGSMRSGEIGYWIDERFAGLGITPTAVAMAVDHSFHAVGLHRLVASIQPENAASRRVMEKLGFREEGLHVREAQVGAAWRDHLCYALTVEDVADSLMTRWRSVVMASKSGATTEARDCRTAEG
jgi:ribosomal-protein-alanine N-acetyltransferase